MLVLSRSKEQTIIIGDDVEVTVVDVRGDKVRLGINAPRNVSVHRKEVYEQVRRDGRRSGPGGASEAPAGVAPVAVVTPEPATHSANGSHAFMSAALDEARHGLAEGGLPIGSVLVRNGQIIGRGRNRRVQKNDPMAHAEIDCLSNAGRQKSYKDTVLYSTLMPCHLCSGAIVQFGIPKVVVGESVNFEGAPDLLRRHGIEVLDLKDPECIRLMSDFIKAHPDLWSEDIGR